MEEKNLKDVVIETIIPTYLLEGETGKVKDMLIDLLKGLAEIEHADIEEAVAIDNPPNLPTGWTQIQARVREKDGSSSKNVLQ